MIAAFNFGQVVVAMRPAVAGFPEAVDGENCRLVDDLQQMARVIEELCQDADQRFRLGSAARRTFERSFTRQALLPRYEEALALLPRRSEFYSPEQVAARA
jgi:glycosyltransferase involved in cell wall biosynthesis